MLVSLSNSDLDEIERLSKEYKDFAYIVSHDLNAPLRHVREFTRLLIGSRSDNLNEEEREYVRLLEGSLSRIDDMQRGLLSFSRVNTIHNDFEDVNVPALMDRVLRDIRQNISVEPQIEVGDLPDVYADPKQAYTVFFNIVENAVKFHDVGAVPVVKINGYNQGDVNIFTVRDNGIGIDEKFYNEAFRIFRRLNAGDLYKGSGVGLTVAQKIIQRHCCEISIKSSVGDYTEVTFSLPAPPSK